MSGRPSRASASFARAKMALAHSDEEFLFDTALIESIQSNPPTQATATTTSTSTLASSSSSSTSSSSSSTFSNAAAAVAAAAAAVVAAATAATAAATAATEATPSEADSALKKKKGRGPDKQKRRPRADQGKGKPIAHPSSSSSIPSTPTTTFAADAKSFVSTEETAEAEAASSVTPAKRGRGSRGGRGRGARGGINEENAAAANEENTPASPLTASLHSPAFTLASTTKRRGRPRKSSLPTTPPTSFLLPLSPSSSSIPSLPSPSSSTSITPLTTASQSTKKVKASRKPRPASPSGSDQDYEEEAQSQSSTEGKEDEEEEEEEDDEFTEDDEENEGGRGRKKRKKTSSSNRGSRGKRGGRGSRVGGRGGRGGGGGSRLSTDSAYSLPSYATPSPFPSLPLSYSPFNHPLFSLPSSLPSVSSSIMNEGAVGIIRDREWNEAVYKGMEKVKVKCEGKEVEVKAFEAVRIEEEEKYMNTIPLHPDSLLSSSSSSSVPSSPFFHPYSYLLNVGGPIHCFRWCPVGSSSSSSSSSFPPLFQTQYLLVSHDCYEKYYTRGRVKEAAEQVMNVWSFGKVTEADEGNEMKNDGERGKRTPYVAMSIFHRHGRVTDMQWLAYGGWQAPDSTLPNGALPRLGILAVAFQDGTIRVVSIPHPSPSSSSSSLPPSPLELDFTQLPSVNLLSPPLFAHLPNSIAPFAECIGWSNSTKSHRLAAGCGDGQLLIWDLTQFTIPSNSLSSTVASTASCLYPSHQVCHTLRPYSITSLCWSPFNSHHLAVGYADGTLRCYDIQQRER